MESLNTRMKKLERDAGKLGRDLEESKKNAERSHSARKTLRMEVEETREKTFSLETALDEEKRRAARAEAAAVELNEKLQEERKRFICRRIHYGFYTGSPLKTAQCQFLEMLKLVQPKLVQKIQCGSEIRS